MLPIVAQAADAPATGARLLAGAELAEALRDSRRRTLAWVDDLSDAQWRPPCQNGVNPVAWELGHLAWFGEFWILRGPHRLGEEGFVHATRPPRIAGPDALFDSARIAHPLRWQAQLPARAELAERLAAQLEACIEALAVSADDDALYFHRLALFHEDMHTEAFAWMRATLGYPPPAGLCLARLPADAPIGLDGGEVRIGWPCQERAFAFDNEMPGRTQRLQPFEIDAQPVTAGQFLRFVEAGGYADAACWQGEAGRWRSSAACTHPARWRLQQTVSGRQWQLRWFDRWTPLDSRLPVIHVNAFEAEAYCTWAGRRLPSAAEWEHAAARFGPTAFHWGTSVWEWTSDSFRPYPGFEPGPYADYSRPWFGNHRELRGGAFATHRRMHDARYRNFFMPERADVFAGFRTASLR